MGGDSPKKDLTSLLELSALGHAAPQDGAPEQDGASALQMAPIEKITEEDFVDLEAMSKSAAVEAVLDPEIPDPLVSGPEGDALPGFSGALAANPEGVN